MAISNPAQKYQAYIQQLVSSGKLSQLSPQAQQQLAAFAANPSNGFPQDPDFKAAINEAGAAGLLPKMTAADWALVAAVPLAAFGGAALLGAGGAGGAGGGYIASDVANTAAATGAGGVTLPAVAGGAAAGGGSLLHSLLPSIIGGGAALGGAAIATHGQTEAAKIAAEQADKALKVQEEQYALQRQDTAPYRALGQGAVGNLGYLSGINLPQSRVDELSSTMPNHPYGTDATHPAPYTVPGARGAGGTQFPGAGQPDPYGTPGAPSGGSLAQLGQPAPQAGMVRVKAQSGQVGMIPQARLQEALAGGMQQV